MKFQHILDQISYGINILMFMLSVFIEGFFGGVGVGGGLINLLPIE